MSPATRASITSAAHSYKAKPLKSLRYLKLGLELHAICFLLFAVVISSEMWPDLIVKAKEGGLDAIETYVFWNAHEPTRGKFNFKGNLDLVRFIKEIQNAGLYPILRIGPYVCAEWNLGGLPAWLRQIPGMEFRVDNKPFKDEMQKFTTLIVDMLKKEKLLAP